MSNEDKTEPAEPAASEAPKAPATKTRKRKKTKGPALQVVPMRRGLACDSATAPTRKQAEAVYDAGFRTWFRYVDRVLADPDKDKRWPINLTRPELAMLLDVGFDVGLVQYYSTGYESQERGARLCGAYGEQLGSIASANARRLGVPQGVTIFCDAEDWIRLPSKLHGFQYLNRWSAANVAAGDEPGLYYGANMGNERAEFFTGADLYGLPRFRAYWKSMGYCPHMPRRGPTMVQAPPVKVAGLELDPNVITLDGKWLSSRYRFKVIRAA